MATAIVSPKAAPERQADLFGKSPRAHDTPARATPSRRSHARATSGLVLLRRLALIYSGVDSDDPRPASFVSNTGRIVGGIAGQFPEAFVRKLGFLADWLYFLGRLFLVLNAILVVILLSATIIAVVPLGLSQDSFLRLPPTGYSLRWIETYLTNSEWLNSTFFSLWISVGGAIIALVLGSIGAYAMARWEGRRKSALELFFISPMIVPQFVVALALYFIFIKLNLVGNPVTYLIAYAVFAFPYVFLIMYAAFQRFEFSLVQSASILGASPLTVWYRIVVPILIPAFLSAGVFAFLTAFDDIVVALFFSTAGQYTLPMRMWADIRTEISPQIAAVALVFLLIALVGWIGAAMIRSVRERLKPVP